MDSLRADGPIFDSRRVQNSIDTPVVMRLRDDPLHLDAHARAPDPGRHIEADPERERGEQRDRLAVVMPATSVEQEERWGRHAGLRRHGSTPVEATITAEGAAVGPPTHDERRASHEAPCAASPSPPSWE
jgi:hypothetical protein